MIRVIDNKYVDLTNDEWTIYQNICESYKKQGGKTLFAGLFETNAQGIILFVRPPSQQFITMEVWLFVMSIFCHQHVREMYKQADNISVQLKEKMQLVDEKIKELDAKIENVDRILASNTPQ